MASSGETSALHKLQSALHDYLALGSDTPLYSAAESLSTEVSHTLAQAGPSDTADESQGDSSPSAPSDFRSATKAAKSGVYDQSGSETSSSDGGTKTDESEQSQEDDQKRKGSGSRPF